MERTIYTVNRVPGALVEVSGGMTVIIWPSGLREAVAQGAVINSLQYKILHANAKR